MVAAIVSKSAYAVHRSVTAACITQWIARGKLTAPALTDDGKIDVALADKQVLVIARRSPPRPRRRKTIRLDGTDERQHAAADLHPVDRPQGARRDREEPIGAFVVVDELPPAWPPRCTSIVARSPRCPDGSRRSAGEVVQVECVENKRSLSAQPRHLAGQPSAGSSPFRPFSFGPKEREVGW
jgi:hypothetical protein